MSLGVALPCDTGGTVGGERTVAAGARVLAANGKKVSREEVNERNLRVVGSTT